MASTPAPMLQCQYNDGIGVLLLVHLLASNRCAMHTRDNSTATFVRIFMLWRGWGVLICIFIRNPSHLWLRGKCSDRSRLCKNERHMVRNGHNMNREFYFSSCVSTSFARPPPPNHDKQIRVNLTNGEWGIWFLFFLIIICFVHVTRYEGQNNSIKQQQLKQEQWTKSNKRTAPPSPNWIVCTVTVNKFHTRDKDTFKMSSWSGINKQNQTKQNSSSNNRHGKIIAKWRKNKTSTENESRLNNKRAYEHLHAEKEQR